MLPRTSLFLILALISFACKGSDKDGKETGSETGDTEDTGDTGDTDDTGDTEDPGDSTRHVLAIMIDGWVPASIAAATTPELDLLMASAAVSLEARVEDTTISGSGQASFLTGVHRDKHWIDDNTFSGENTWAYPSFLARLETARPEAGTALYHTWEPLRDVFSADADTVEFHAYSDDGDAQMVAAAVEDLAIEDIHAAAIMISDLDTAGHTWGFSETVAEYLLELESIDAQIGQIMDAVNQRANRDQEEWLVLLSTDHSGSGTSHGQNIPEHRLVPLIVSGDGAVTGEIRHAPDAVDIASTALTHLGVALDGDLDGRAVGLSATPAPTAAMDVNLVVNGGGELERGYGDYEPDAAVPGWVDSGSFTVMFYGASGGFPTDGVDGPSDRGENFLCGGGTTTDSDMFQDIDLSALSGAIDAGGVTYDFSAWLGGYDQQDDRADAGLEFLDGNGGPLSTVMLTGPEAAERNGSTGFMERRDTGDVPPLARTARVHIVGVTSYGYNDGYADNLSLVLSSASQ